MFPVTMIATDALDIMVGTHAPGAEMASGAAAVCPSVHCPGKCNDRAVQGDEPEARATSPTSVAQPASMLRHGEDTYEGMSPLHVAAYNGDLRTCIALHEAGVSMLSLTSTGDTAGTVARQAGNEVCAGMLDMLHDLEARDQQLTDLKLKQYATTGEADKLASAIESGARVNSVDYLGRTPLHVACATGHAEAARVLLRFGADASLCDRKGRTALQTASLYGMGHMVDVLTERSQPEIEAPRLARNFDMAVTKTHKDKMMGPLQVAARNGDLKTCAKHYEKGTSVQVVTSTGETVVELARKAGHLVCAGMLQLLVQLDARDQMLVDLNLKQYATKGQADKLRGALQEGARVNSTDYVGRTPLHVACAMGHTEAAHVLMKFGADVSIRDRKGLNALETAKAFGMGHMARVFVQGITAHA